LLTLEAKSARILVDGEEKEIATEELITGDIMLIKPGTITKGAPTSPHHVSANSARWNKVWWQNDRDT